MNTTLEAAIDRFASLPDDEALEEFERGETKPN